MHYQMRNWYNFTWLSGDFNVEQHVHYLDVCAWVMKEQYPVKAVGMGGRQVLTGPQYGQIYDHFSVVYEYADGAKLVSNCRQQPNCKNDMSVKVSGRGAGPRSSERRKGLRIHTPAGDWVYDGPLRTRCIRPSTTSCSPASATASRSTTASTWPGARLLAIMGRMAAYTGQEITWEMAHELQGRPQPVRYDWDAQPPEAAGRHAGPDAFHLGSFEAPLHGPDRRRFRALWIALTALGASDRRAWLGIAASGLAVADDWRSRRRHGPRPSSRTGTRGKPTRFQIACMTLPVFSIPARSRADWHQGGRLSICGLGHDAQGGRHRRCRSSPPMRRPPRRRNWPGSAATWAWSR